jgi:hypothetical protein
MFLRKELIWVPRISWIKLVGGILVDGILISIIITLCATIILSPKMHTT